MSDFQRIEIGGLDDEGNLRWLCVRGDGGALPHLPDDATRDGERPMPW